MTTTQHVDPFEADIRRDSCTTCGAGVDQPCTSSNGMPRTEAHRGRERAWTVRRAREIAGTVDWNSPTWGSNPVHVSPSGDLAGEQRTDG